MERLLTNAYNEELSSNRDLNDDVEIDDDDVEVATDENGDIIENLDGPNESKCSINYLYILVTEADKSVNISCFKNSNILTTCCSSCIRRFLLRQFRSEQFRG
jgi:hypothetical protein